MGIRVVGCRKSIFKLIKNEQEVDIPTHACTEI